MSLYDKERILDHTPLVSKAGRTKHIVISGDATACGAEISAKRAVYSTGPVARYQVCSKCLTAVADVADDQLGPIPVTENADGTFAVVDGLFGPVAS